MSLPPRQVADEATTIRRSRNVHIKYLKIKKNSIIYKKYQGKST